MTVMRIVANIRSDDPAQAEAFYGEVFGLDLVMDHGWIRTYAGFAETRPQLSVAADGGSGAPAPDLSIEVDDIDDVHGRVLSRGFAVEYGPRQEPWGVKRFFVRDPFGRLVNVLSHA